MASAPPAPEPAPTLAGRPAWAEVDLAAVRHNVAVLAELAAPATLCAVVKAGGYGHGAVPVARTALDAGASWLAVALAGEGAELRAAGILAPVLVLTEPSAAEAPLAVAHGLIPTVYTEAGIDALAVAVAAAGGPPLRVHLKVDTGMHRVGVEPGHALARARAVVERPELELAGVWTHCAVADEPDNAFTAEQLTRFDAVLTELRGAGIDPGLVHVANSAAAIGHPAARRDLVRCGIAVYGLAPSPAMEGMADLRPALSLRGRITTVRVVPAGEAASYGLRRRFAHDTVVATVPLGYADGVPRRLFDVGATVLVGGRRRPLAGVVTMDQLLVDCGAPGAAGAAVAPGDEVVLIGRQGDDEVTAAEWAGLLGTISYEVVCGIGPRVPRVYRGEP